MIFHLEMTARIRADNRDGHFENQRRAQEATAVRVQKRRNCSVRDGLNTVRLAQ